MKWEVVDTGPGSAEENMERDVALLKDLQTNPRPILHFYDWVQDAATYGHFIDPTQFLKMEGVRKRGLQLAKRPTGGGIVFHLWDLAFSVLIPKSHAAHGKTALENYAFVNGAVKRATQQFLGKEVSLTPTDIGEIAGFCMAKPTKYDVMLGGKKIAGAAQRQQKWGFLHQGTIALVQPSADYLSDVLQDGRVKEAILANTFSLTDNISKARQEMRQLLREFLTYD
jgi:lipoate-protein ligase A